MRKAFINQHGDFMPQKTKALNPFAVRYSEYAPLSDDEKREFHEKIYMENYDWIESELARRKAEWMIVINGHVVKSSSTLNRIPSKPQLDRLGKKKDLVPFLFVRNIPIEESKATEPQHITSWSRVSINDFYPTIALVVGKSNWSDSKLLKDGKLFVADFDSGCPAIIFDANTLEDELLSAMTAHVQGQHLSRPYSYSMQKLKIGVHPSPEKLRSKTITVRAVKNWERSPFKNINPNRQALIGRNLLLELSLKILLDGQNRTTEILE